MSIHTMHDYICLHCAKETNNYICLRGAFLELKIAKNWYYRNRVLVCASLCDYVFFTIGTF